MADDDMMDKTVNAIMTAFIAVILIASAFIPTAIDQLGLLDKMADNEKYADFASVIMGYEGLIGVVITVTILGIIIGVLRTYNLKDAFGKR